MKPPIAVRVNQAWVTEGNALSIVGVTLSDYRSDLLHMFVTPGEDGYTVQIDYMDDETGEEKNMCFYVSLPVPRDPDLTVVD